MNDGHETERAIQRARIARCWRRSISATVGAVILMAGCSSASDSHTGPAPSSATANSPVSPSGAGPSSVGAPIQLTADPCSLLTADEIEGAIGPGAELGGFGKDLPGRCTHSVHGDVGAGVVAVVLEDPLNCAALLRALGSSSLEGTNAVRVDVGDGGVYVQDADVQFSIGGGCVSVGGSTRGVNLGQDKLVALATAVATRIG